MLAFVAPDSTLSAVAGAGLETAEFICCVVFMTFTGRVLSVLKLTVLNSV